MATIGATCVEIIEAALAKLERELVTAEASRKEMLQWWIADVQQALRRLGRRTLH